MKWHELSKLKNLCAENKFKKKKEQKIKYFCPASNIKKKMEINQN